MTTTPARKPMRSADDGLTAGTPIRAKWVMDGSSTLSQAADSLEKYALWLRELERLGWTLDGPIEDDYGHLVDPTGSRGLPVNDEDADLEDYRS